MSRRSLEDLLQTVASPVKMLRNSQIGPYVFPVVPPEFTNWRDEQRAWQETAVLFDQSHHMTDMYIEGPDALKLLSDLGVNTVRNFAVDKAKQFVACNHDGHVIGDAILFFLAENTFNLVGRPSAHNWVQYHSETQGYDVSIERDERSAARSGPPLRKAYRYQIQGPRAQDVMRKLTGAPAPDIGFFNMDAVRIAGRPVRALRHGMVGQPGWELFGPWEDGEAVRAAICEAGREFGIRQVGAKAYSTSALESGWIPSPVPAIYSGNATKAYRRWLPANGYEGTASLGGSFESDDIADYYLTPYDLGYGPMVSFDHEFIGRQSLEEIAADPPRRKVSLAWNAEDVTRVVGSLFGASEGSKFIDLPLANYATLPYDKVLCDGATVGLSTYTGYTCNGRTMLSLGIVDTRYSAPGTEVTVVWGEANGGSSKPTVERHAQAEIRAIVSPVPYSRVAREEYAEGWRTRRH